MWKRNSVMFRTLKVISSDKVTLDLFSRSRKKRKVSSCLQSLHRGPRQCLCLTLCYCKRLNTNILSWTHDPAIYRLYMIFTYSHSFIHHSRVYFELKNWPFSSWFVSSVGRALIEHCTGQRKHLISTMRDPEARLTTQGFLERELTNFFS